jgi:hypothetical protein
MILQRGHRARLFAMLTIALAGSFLVVGTLGPAHRSPYYWWIVPPPALLALALGWKAWVTPEKSARLATAAIALLLIVLVFSHLLPRASA